MPKNRNLFSAIFWGAALGFGVTFVSFNAKCPPCPEVTADQIEAEAGLNQRGPVMTLEEACQILARIHTRPSREYGVIPLPNAPIPKGTEDQYVEAWKVIADHSAEQWARLPVEPTDEIMKALRASFYHDPCNFEAHYRAIVRAGRSPASQEEPCPK